jgi:hypothetical protein
MSKEAITFHEVARPTAPIDFIMTEKFDDGAVPANNRAPAYAPEEKMSVTHMYLTWLESNINHRVGKLEATAEEALRLEEKLHDMTLERTIKIVKELVYMHESDQNFSGETLNQMKDFLANPPFDDIPDKNETLRLMKLEALLATENSPYAEVRANCDPTDDPSLPCSTLRAWFIGITFCILGTFIDNLFAFRYPNIYIGANVGQLLACEYEAPKDLLFICSQVYRSRWLFLCSRAAKLEFHHFRPKVRVESRPVQPQGTHDDHHHDQCIVHRALH